ncbi:MAG: hypothetical protein M3Q63_02315 [bacterium]|nr:hypothetical protein [bacterium]
MNDIQKTVFLFAAAAVIGTTAFNATYFVTTHQEQLASAIEANKGTLTQTTPLETITIPTEKSTTAPINVKAVWGELEEGIDIIKVTWQGSTIAGDEYSVYRKAVSEDDLVLIETLPADTTLFGDSNITLGETYTYQIKTQESSLSEPSDEVIAGELPEKIQTVFGELEG